MVVEAMRISIDLSTNSRMQYDEKTEGLLLGFIFNDEIGFYVITIHKQKAYLGDKDWIIIEPDGKHAYPCKPDIFEMTYEEVKE